MTTETADRKIGVLESLIGAMDERDANFARDLIEGEWGYRSRGYLTTRQWSYVDDLDLDTYTRLELDGYIVEGEWAPELFDDESNDGEIDE